MMLLDNKSIYNLVGIAYESNRHHMINNGVKQTDFVDFFYQVMQTEHTEFWNSALSSFLT